MFLWNAWAPGEGVGGERGTLKIFDEGFPFLLRWGSPAKQSGRNEGIFSSFGVKKFRKFLTFLHIFAE